MVIESSFGLLKSRFRVLHRKCDASEESLRTMALASIVLHNICIQLEDVLPRKYDLRFDTAGNKRRSSEEIADLLNMTNRVSFSDPGTAMAKLIRDSIKDKFWEEHEVPTS